MDAGDEPLWKSKKWGAGIDTNKHLSQTKFPTQTNSRTICLLGTSQLSISYDSDLLRDPGRVTTSDASRRAYITADIYSTIQIMYETAAKVLGPAGGKSPATPSPTSAPAHISSLG